MPHIRLTAEEIKENWKLGFYNATGYLFHLVGALRKKLWKLTIDSVDKFCKEWEISRASFYRAKAQLISQGRLEEDIRSRLVLWLTEADESMNVSQNEDSEDTETPENPPIFPCEENCLSSDTECLNAEAECLKPENSIDLKPANHKQSESPSTLDQLSNKSLSQSRPPRGFHPERETSETHNEELISFIQSKLSRSTAIKNSPRAYAIGCLKNDREFWEKEFIKSKNSSFRSNVPATATTVKITPINEMTEEEKRSSALSRIQAKWNVSALRDSAIAEAKKWGFSVTPNGILEAT